MLLPCDGRNSRGGIAWWWVNTAEELDVLTHPDQTTELEQDQRACAFLKSFARSGDQLCNRPSTEQPTFVASTRLLQFKGPPSTSPHLQETATSLKPQAWLAGWLALPPLRLLQHGDESSRQQSVQLWLLLINVLVLSGSSSHGHDQNILPHPT